MVSRTLPLTHSKHILNAQVAIRAPCCKKFFDVSGRRVKDIIPDSDLGVTRPMRSLETSLSSLSNERSVLPASWH
jgi:hypothetical protein